jgi:hypothetical protein
MGGGRHWALLGDALRLRFCWKVGADGVAGCKVVWGLQVCGLRSCAGKQRGMCGWVGVRVTVWRLAGLGCEISCGSCGASLASGVEGWRLHALPASASWCWRRGACLTVPLR